MIWINPVCFGSVCFAPSCSAKGSFRCFSHHRGCRAFDCLCACSELRHYIWTVFTWVWKLGTKKLLIYITVTDFIITFRVWFHLSIWRSINFSDCQNYLILEQWFTNCGTRTSSGTEIQNIHLISLNSLVCSIHVSPYAQKTFGDSFHVFAKYALKPTGNGKLVKVAH